MCPSDRSLVYLYFYYTVRTPLNHIINYLEMALDGPLDLETRDNLSMSHAASKVRATHKFLTLS